MAKLNFDATGVPPDPGRGDPIPLGWYNAAMTASETKPTASGTDSSYLECVFSVLDGQHQGRKLYHRLNLRNANAQAQEIAYKQLSAIMHAVGHLQCGDSTELHGRPLKLRVKVKPAEGTYEASNEITAFKNINEQVGTTAAAPAFGHPPAAVVPPPVGQPPAGWAPPAAPPQAPPQAPAQPWAAPAAAPAGPPPGWTPPAAAPAGPPPGYAPSAPPAWQPPPGAPAQPWAAPPPAAAAPAATQAPVPAPGPPAWQPPAAPASAQPPWMTAPPAPM